MLYRSGSRLAYGLVLLLACGETDIALEPDVARSVFELSNARIHELHIDAIDAGTFPARMTGACAGGGTLEMIPGDMAAGADIPDLLHPFSACVEGEFTFDGDLDYTNFVNCDDGTLSYEIDGLLEVAGYGRCAIDATETCGFIRRGVACGISLAN